MMEDAIVSRGRRAVGAVILLGIWVLFLGLLWVIFASGPDVLPAWLFLPGFVLTLAFGVCLLAARRWDRVWRRLFDSTVRVPAWIWIGGATTLGAAVAASLVQPLSVTGILWIAVVCGAVCYAIVVASRRRWLRDAVAYPSWMAIVVVAILLLVATISTLETNAVLSVVFLLAMLLFSFHVWFLLPLSLYQAGTTPPSPSREELPSLTVLIPAYNEHTLVGPCIESVLESAYPPDKREIVVIDDGSSDGTYHEASAYPGDQVTVIRRENGGKHAALNLGLACTSGTVVATVDADSRPAPSSIARMVRQLRSEPDVGGLSAIVLAMNDRSLIPGIQRIEYAVSNTTRRAYSVFDAVPVIPGCLGVYRREALEDVWRYDPDTVTEDFDLTVKLLKRGWGVQHGTGVVWTVPPRTLTALWHQRLRWYQGGLETLRKHRNVLFQPRYGYLHALTIPARFSAHLLGPVLSITILVAVVYGLLFAPSAYLLGLIGIFFLFTVLLTLYSIVLEGEPLRELLYAPVLFVGYRHFVDCSIGVGNLAAVLGRRKW